MKPFLIPTQKPKILIVDDERFNLNVLNGLLKDDYKIMVAVNGEQGLLAAMNSRPDLILLDITMPEMDGLEVCRRLKQDPLTANIPVVFISGLTQEEDEIKGFEVGAVDYIPKPFNPVIVKARVHTHVRLKIQSDLLEGMAFRDGLTGVANRRYFDQMSEMEWRRCQLLKLPLAILMIDIDHFKLFNDHYGHAEGDRCLTAAAQALTKCANQPGDLFARYGGEEFVSLLPNSTPERAETVATEMISQIYSLGIAHAKSDTASCITISLGGLALQANDSCSLETAMHHADQFLYQAKYNGRNQAKIHKYEISSLKKIEVDND